MSVKIMTLSLNNRQETNDFIDGWSRLLGNPSNTSGTKTSSHLFTEWDLNAQNVSCTNEENVRKYSVKITLTNTAHDSVPTLPYFSRLKFPVDYFSDRHPSTEWKLNVYYVNKWWTTLQKQEERGSKLTSATYCHIIINKQIE